MGNHYTKQAYLYLPELFNKSYSLTYNFLSLHLTHLADAVKYWNESYFKVCSSVRGVSVNKMVDYRTTWQLDLQKIELIKTNANI
jgi:hypothetical protein